MLHKKNATNAAVVCVFILICVFGNGVCVDATFVSSVNYHFETFNPYSLVRFFEFSDKGWIISEQCLKDLYVYVEGLKVGAVWAAKLYDANGYYGGGGFNGSTLRINNPNICRHLTREHLQHMASRLSPYNVNRTIVPFGVQTIIGKYLLTLQQANSTQHFKIQQQICLPRSCVNKDLQQILEIYLYQSNLIVQNISYIDHRILNAEHSIFQEMDFYALLILLVGSKLVYMLVWLAQKFTTILSAQNLSADSHQVLSGYLLKYGKRDACITEAIYNQITVSEERIYNFSLYPTKVQFEKFLRAISLNGIIKQLLQSKCSQNPLHGLHVYFCVLYLYAHLATELALMSNNIEYAKIKKTNFILKYYSYMLDVYFFQSGAQLAYKFASTFPNAQLNVLQQLVHLLKLNMEKLMSVTPSYSFCLFAAYLLDKHLQQNVAVELPSYDYRNCQRQKLSNLFYVDTFYPLVNRCMPWTWLISLEVKFYIMACLILLLAEINKQYAAIIGFGLYAVSTIAATIWELYRHNVNLGASLIGADELQHFNLVFDNICLRVLPYIVGTCMGSILHRTDCKFKMQFYLFLAGWTACVLILYYFFYAYAQILESVNHVTQACLETTAHTMWTVIMAWILLTAISQYGALLRHLLCFKYARTLDTLTPIYLMLAPIIIRLYIFTANSPIYTAESQILVLAIGCVLTVYTCAFVLHVLLDGPLKAALKATLWKNI